MSEKMTALRRDFLPDDLLVEADGAGVNGSIAVQARQSIEETKWLSDLAANSAFIRGVVGWAPLIDQEIAHILESLAALPKIKAMRHVLHDEADDFYMLRPDFNRGVSLLKDFDLTYDLLIFERQLPQTIAFVDRHPDQRFVLDHIAKPQIRSREVSPWRENLHALAERQNVYCKVSGMATEADWAAWTEDGLQIYFEIVLGAFGPSRLMFGSDWPVVTLASSYGRWMQFFQRAIQSLSRDEKQQMLCGTAVEAYKLDEK
jgi:L-fuconolactonase